jgi:uncharacterized protein involved in outer membrane biogenesis
MKSFKVSLVVVGLILVLAVGVFAYLVNNISDIVERVIESEGTRITQTEVSLGDADIQLRQGRGELSDLRIANPRPFDSPYALRADTLALQLKPKTVVGDVVVIEEVLVQGVVITAEQQGMTTNLQALLKSIQASATGEEPAPEDGRDVRLMIEKLKFAGSSLNLVTEEHGDYTLDLPEIELIDVGTREQGLTPAELGREVLKPVLAQAREAVQKRLEELLKEEAESRLKDKAREKLGRDTEDNLRKLRDALK